MSDDAAFNSAKNITTAETPPEGRFACYMTFVQNLRYGYYNQNIQRIEQNQDGHMQTPAGYAAREVAKGISDDAQRRTWIQQCSEHARDEGVPFSFVEEFTTADMAGGVAVRTD